MTTVEQPITRTDLREELDRLRDEIARTYATKADLAQLETRLTKWMIGLMTSSIVSASAIAVAVSRLWG